VFALSDVIDDDVSVIGSGPTTADASTFADGLDMLERFGGVEAYPPCVTAHLERGAAGGVEETPKPGDPRLARSRTTVIGSRHDAMAGVAAEAERRGYRVVTIDEPVVGEARVAAHHHVERVAALIDGIARPSCVVSSGETTVTVTGGGTGGRNQEFALASVDRLTKLGPTALLASVGTDGIDGPTDAAGAIVDSMTAERARMAGLGDGKGCLDDNDAYRFFSTLGDLVRIGPTGTNVGDLQVVLVA
jgi:hydroxypyruvate reductase